MAEDLQGLLNKIQTEGLQKAAAEGEATLVTLEEMYEGYKKIMNQKLKSLREIWGSFYNAIFRIEV